MNTKIFEWQKGDDVPAINLEPIRKVVVSPTNFSSENTSSQNFSDKHLAFQADGHNELDSTSRLTDHETQNLKQRSKIYEFILVCVLIYSFALFLFWQRTNQHIARLTAEISAMQSQFSETQGQPVFITILVDQSEKQPLDVPVDSNHEPLWDIDQVDGRISVLKGHITLP
ncbi:hypothetical protein KFU94_22970 [Chloroflexi bacterium TSY]|nr:hypothetical protein [Chloroflexi bacterium TSY]